MASGTNAGQIYLRDPNTGQTLASGHRKSIHLWDLDKSSRLGAGQARRSLQGHTNEVRSLDFTPDGQLLASGSRDATICLWHVHSGQKMATLRSHVAGIWAIKFSPDGSLLAGGGDGHPVQLWNISTLLNTSATRFLATADDATPAPAATKVAKPSAGTRI